jgi:hypothetical protein
MPSWLGNYVLPYGISTLATSLGTFWEKDLNLNQSLAIFLVWVGENGAFYVSVLMFNWLAPPEK